ncbi:MAG TPA: hypothetical protein VFN49_11535 [Candidatus Aquilonibacter sp.]|nr:hypothetical protein [Candidatus Aquilonibacter sp.]
MFEGFVLPDAVETMLAEAQRAHDGFYRRDARYSAYLAAEATGGEDHPTRRLHRYALDAVANDRLEPHGALSFLYRHPAFVQFIADALKEPQLYPLGDPMLGLTLTYLNPGDEHGWHFDANDFVVSLLLREPQNGGTFEFAPFIRSQADPQFDKVDAIMSGNRTGLRSIRAKAGTLALFEGRRSLHRVSPVEGERTRVIALFSYDRRPNLVHDDAVHLRTFGRTLAQA